MRASRTSASARSVTHACARQHTRTEIHAHRFLSSPEVTAQLITSTGVPAKLTQLGACGRPEPSLHIRKNPIPPPPTLLASSRIHPARNSSSVISAGSVSLVLIRGPLSSNAMTVGTDEMTYVCPKPSRMMSGESYSTVVSATPPSGSPAPDSTSE